MPAHGAITFDPNAIGGHNWCGSCGIHGPGTYIKMEGTWIEGRAEVLHIHRCKGRKPDNPYSTVKCLERTNGRERHPPGWRGIREGVAKKPPPHIERIQTLERQVADLDRRNGNLWQMFQRANAAAVRANAANHNPNPAIQEQLGKMMTLLDDNMDKIPVGDAVELANGIKKIYDLVK